MASLDKTPPKDGSFKRPQAQFRSQISSEPVARFPAEPGRYVLYLNLGCPWAHRVNIVRSLKGLEDLIEIIVMDYVMTPGRGKGWTYTGRNGTDAMDRLHGFQYHGELYLKADPEYPGRYTVPVIWDKLTSTIVNNESSEIIRMLYTAFDSHLPSHLREANKPGGGLYPDRLKSEIDAMNEWVYDMLNNGVYKAGFAKTQKAYDDAVHPVFEALDRLEEHLSDPAHQPYLFGAHITEADIRLYPTLIRFDAAYHTVFKCNLKMIRHDYPRLHLWLRRLYWDQGPRTNGGAFYNTTYLDIVS